MQQQPDAHQRPDPQELGTSEAYETHIFQRLTLLQRQMGVAATDERFELAAGLRDERAQLVGCIPLHLRLQLGQCEVLQDSGASPQEKRDAVAALRAYGTSFSVPALAGCLQDASLRDEAAAVMWELWRRHPDQGVRALVAEGLRAMDAGTPDSLVRAERVFTRAIEADPSYAEAWNKRATARYMVGKFGGAISDCNEVLSRQPYHFGALSGLGWCHVKRQDVPAAVAAFEAALLVHPGLMGLSQVVRSLRDGGGFGAPGGDGRGGGDELPGGDDEWSASL